MPPQTHSLSDAELVQVAAKLSQDLVHFHALKAELQAELARLRIQVNDHDFKLTHHDNDIEDLQRDLAKHIQNVLVE